MIDILPSAPHVAAFHFTGTLTGEDYDACVAEIETRLSMHPRIAVYTDLTGMTGMSAEAMGKDVRYAIDKFGEYSRFARAAVVTERHWLANVSTFVGKLVPTTELKTFEPDERGAAMTWASQPVPRR
ncbi:STAS/SEC14 domain-containing protein [Marilutibacter chinensis]|uniref:STAS/SEC14 domain-containing protein n=1 Tax=Marilutibacter chinensis TaxID=2912247 RepID=A0ABS9HQK9_9GAMM|nr:STAS/SEC14 domain-containing protein [Lysobacter chinensis]MCF7221229.1 STAS/SEC14 domain-containing protein [Lysobacter chinensis]MCF7223030.1 STAS/SEC14 domain-containing protein [Lysobacter chinensis]